MKFYIKQKVFTFGDKFNIYDASGNVRYSVKGEVFSLGKKLHLYDGSDRELAYIEQKLFSFLPKYHIHQEGKGVVEVVREFSFFYPKYSVEPLGWTISGDFFDHDYEICAPYGGRVASVSKQLFTFGDAYQISINEGVDEIVALATVLVIDACLEAQRNN